MVDEAQRADAVVATVRRLVEELSPRAAARVGLDSLLDRDLGLDSLALVELTGRLEEAFGVAGPGSDAALLEARTPRELLAALPAGPSPGRAPPPVAPPPPPSPAAASGNDPGATMVVPQDARTMIDVLDWYAAHLPNQVHVRLLEDAGGAQELTYAALAARARAAAVRLRDDGVGAGDSVALMLPTGLDYFVAFFGTLLAGGVPVPIYPPLRASDIGEHLRRQSAILRNAEARLLVTVPEAARAARLLRLHVPGLRRIVATGDLAGDGADLPAPRVTGSSVALLQYTSGSTSAPKGVVLTHDNLLASVRAMGEAAGVRGDDVFISWLPLYHDMGLIGAWLGSLSLGMPLVLMAPTSFLARPARWLQAISAYRGTITCAPNFAYDLCTRRIADEDVEGLDLGSVRMALNGAEPVSAAVLRGFSERFGPAGFRPEAMFPVYGLAEASLGVTFPAPGQGPTVDRVAREAFAASGVAEPSGEAEESLEFVGSGRPLPGFELRIVGPAGQPVAERREGRIEFRGPAATSGYHRNPGATAELVHDGWLDSGDLGYLSHGELFVTGRARDLVIRAGRNIHPQEIEEAVGDVPGVRRGRAVAFGVPDASGATERLVVVAETRESGAEEQGRLRDAIVAAAVDVVGAPPDDVVLAPPGAIPKTSSGKVRRADARRRYTEGRLDEARRPVWRQVVDLASSGALVRAGRLPRAAADGLYGAYALGVVGAVGAPVWFLEGVVPPGRRWGVFRAAGRAVLLACGTPPHVEGAGHLPDGPFVVVANHASILDGLVLAAALPRPLVFPVAGELAAGPMTGPFLRRLGVTFVDRADRANAAAAVGGLAEVVRRDQVLAFFPEGTMAREPGLHPFRMGAFVIGAETGVPVVPVAIRGTGTILRGDRRFPHHGRIDVVISPPLVAPEPGWPGAVALRDAARAALLANLDEPDLGA